MTKNHEMFLWRWRSELAAIAVAVSGLCALAELAGLRAMFGRINIASHFVFRYSVLPLAVFVGFCAGRGYIISNFSGSDAAKTDASKDAQVQRQVADGSDVLENEGADAWSNSEQRLGLLLVNSHANPEVGFESQEFMDCEELMECEDKDALFGESDAVDVNTFPERQISLKRQARDAHMVQGNVTCDLGEGSLSAGSGSVVQNSDQDSGNLVQHDGDHVGTKRRPEVIDCQSANWCHQSMYSTAHVEKRCPVEALRLHDLVQVGFSSDEPQTSSRIYSNTGESLLAAERTVCEDSQSASCQRGGQMQSTSSSGKEPLQLVYKNTFLDWNYDGEDFRKKLKRSASDSDVSWSSGGIDATGGSWFPSLASCSPQPSKATSQSSACGAPDGQEELWLPSVAVVNSTHSMDTFGCDSYPSSIFQPKAGDQRQNLDLPDGGVDGVAEVLAGRIQKHSFAELSPDESTSSKQRAIFESQETNELVWNIHEETGTPIEDLKELQIQGVLLQIPRTEDGGFMTVGSIQHGSGSCRPCIFWYRRSCVKGITCTHCHFLHEGQKRKRIRPSKSTRLRRREDAAALGDPESVLNNYRSHLNSDGFRPRAKN